MLIDTLLLLLVVINLALLVRVRNQFNAELEDLRNRHTAAMHRLDRMLQVQDQRLTISNVRHAASKNGVNVS
jgi:predicted transglutaminase-like protease